VRPIAKPEICRADWTAPAWLVPEVRLEIDFDPARTRVAARIEVRRNGTHALPLRLDGEGVKLLSLRVDGRASAHKLDRTGITLRLAGDAAVVETLVEVAPAANPAQVGLFECGGLIASHCEPQGFRRITYFPDRPDVLARFRVRLTADRARYPVLLSNGDPAGAGQAEGGRHWAEWDDPWPKPSYLFAVLAGDLGVRRDAFLTRSGRAVAIGCFASEADLPFTGDAVAALKEAMAWDEANYGREYDLDALNLAVIPGFRTGAMENKGLLFFDRAVLADPETGTDAERDAIAMLVAHEYLHNWSGNRVTIRDWFELGWKEGFTVFRDQGFSASRGSPAARRIDDVRVVRSGGGAGAVRPERCTDVAGLFNRATYTKAAEIVRMAEAALGPAGFRSAAAAFFDEHDGRAVTWEDFLGALGEAGDVGGIAEWLGKPDMPPLLPVLPDDAEKLAAIAAGDADPLARWAAMQALMAGTVLQESDDRLLLDVAGAALVEPDAGLAARLLEPPHWSEMTSLVQPFDPAPLLAGLARLRRRLGTALEVKWRALQDAPAGDAGARALRNLALDYLVAAEAPGVGALALAQLKAGPTMTERDGALRALAHSDLPERAEGLALFHATWRGHPAALDKWFAAQAGSRRPAALDEARRLLAHPDFTLSRPTRIGALFGGLGANLGALHHPSGLGYRFLADAALAVAGRNPAAAARIAAPLLQAPPLEPRRAALLAREVERLRAAPQPIAIS
jgi:aminopeptidase N